MFSEIWLIQRMSDRQALIANYIQRQKDLATIKERHAKLTNERTDKIKLFERTEVQLKNLECIAHRIGDVHQKITDDRILVRTSGGSRLVVGCRPKIERSRLKPGSRVTLDMSTFTIMQILPREVDPNVHNMQAEDPGANNGGFNDVGGLTSQIRDLRETVEGSHQRPCITHYPHGVEDIQESQDM